jgi:hypothetical protein
MMKINTTASSLMLSRWKQVAKTSSSLASAQMGSLYERQKARLHAVQVLAEPSAARPSRSEVLVEDLGGLSAMMVLLLKQTHLQKDVAEAVFVGG